MIPKKPDEIAFMRWSLDHLGYSFIDRPTKKYPAEYTEINSKRRQFILAKWRKNGFYDYVGNIDHGWLTEEGISFFQEQVNEYTLRLKHWEHENNYAN